MEKALRLTKKEFDDFLKFNKIIGEVHLVKVSFICLIMIPF